MTKASANGIASKLAFFDLEGVVLQYGKSRPIPLMGELLNDLVRRGWNVIILSSHSKDGCARRLKDSGIDLGGGIQIMSSGDSDKGSIISKVLKDGIYESCIFVDDKPANLQSVRENCGEKVRVIGFLGSRKYASSLSAWCARNRVELALSAVDLGKGLKFDPEGHLSAAAHWSDKELAELLPGLDHPASSLGDDDDRSVLCILTERENIQDFASIFANTGWIACGECLWKVFSEFVVRSLGGNDKTLGYSAQQHTSRLKELYTKSSDAAPIRNACRNAFSQMMKGIKEIGVEAENCRIANLPMDKKRIDFVQEQLREVFGSDWEG